MAKIFPFKGITFNDDLEGQIGKLLCPPFDVIEEELKNSLYELSEFNVIRLENGKSFDSDNQSDNKYKRASAFFQKLLNEKILIQKSRDYFFILEENFQSKNSIITRRSLIANVELHEYNEKIIFPHEKTRKKQRSDRLELMKSTEANFSSIMCTVEDQDQNLYKFLAKEANGVPKYQGIIPDMHEFKLWEIEDDKKISYLSELIDSENIYIADGHHRYETALEFNKIQSDQSSKRMMNIISLKDEGLLLLGYHRAIAGLDNEKLNNLINELKEVFDFKSTKWNDSFFQWNYDDGHKILMTDNKSSTILTPKNKNNSIYQILHQVFSSIFSESEIIDYVRYEHSSESMKEKLHSNELQVGFFMNALSKAFFLNTVSQGKLLPPKSTLFYPKLPTGLVIQYLK